MTALPVKILRLAKEDLREAYRWYENQAAGLGVDFLREAVTALRKAARQPALFPLVDREFGVRRVLVKRFPYKAFFTVEPDRIVVHAIIDARRCDQIWAERFR